MARSHGLVVRARKAGSARVAHKKARVVVQSELSNWSSWQHGLAMAATVTVAVTVDAHVTLNDEQL
jgi:hypothetical protein